MTISMHNKIEGWLETGEFSTAGAILPIAGVAAGIGKVLGWTAGTPVATASVWAPGALNVDYTNAIPYYNSGTYASPTWTNMVAAAAGSLDAAYGAAGIGRAITVDAGAVDLNGTHTSNNVLEVANNQAAGTGALIDLAHTNTGANDIDGTGSSWAVTAAGAITGASLITTGDVTIGGDLAVTGSFTLAGTTFTGTVAVGSSGAGEDFYIYTDTAGDYISVLDDTKEMLFVDCTLHMQDSDKIHLGSGTTQTGDYAVYSDGTDLYIVANANVAGQTLYLGDDTNDLDVVWESDTSGDLIKLDSSAMSATFTDIEVAMTESATGTTSLTITSEATSVSVVTITAGGNIASDMAALHVAADDAVASGGNVFRVSHATGTPNAASILVEFAAAGQDMLGIVADVDTATGDGYSFNCGGNTATGKAVFKVTADGVPAAADSYLAYFDYSGMTSTNNPVAFKIKSKGTGAQLQIESADTGALGVQLQTYHTSTASAADDDQVFVIDAYGLDSGNASTLYCKVEFEIMNKTAGQEDGRFVFSAAAHDGSLVQMATLNPRAGGALAEWVLGAGNANAYLSTSGTGDLIIDTNQGTNSCSITLADGANGDMAFATNGTGSQVLGDAAVQFQHRIVAAGTAADTPDNTDGVIQVNTDGATDCTVTLPQAASNLGLMLTIMFHTDGGNNLVVTTEATDKLIHAGSSDDTSTMNDGNDFIVVIAVEDDKWLSINEQGGTFS